MELLEWDDIEVKVKKNDKLTPIEEFIYSHEPAGVKPGADFRFQLNKMLEYVRDNNETA